MWPGLAAGLPLSQIWRGWLPRQMGRQLEDCSDLHPRQVGSGALEREPAQAALRAFGQVHRLLLSPYGAYAETGTVMAAVDVVEASEAQDFFLEAFRIPAFPGTWDDPADNELPSLCRPVPKRIGQEPIFKEQRPQLRGLDLRFHRESMESFGLSGDEVEWLWSQGISNMASAFAQEALTVMHGTSPWL